MTNSIGGLLIIIIKGKPFKNLMGICLTLEENKKLKQGDLGREIRSMREIKNSSTKH